MIPQLPITKTKSVNALFLDRLYGLIKRNIKNPSLNVEMLSFAMGMSKSTLNRKLKSLLGLSTNNLIKQFRMEQAKEYIKSGYNISDAAFSVGIENPSYFSYCFKKNYGKSPSEYKGIDA